LLSRFSRSVSWRCAACLESGSKTLMFS
jgi:hypothetical protein